MRLQWFWNRTFEGLMESVSGFLEKNPNIQVAHTEMKISPDGATFYWTMYYRPGA